MKGRLWFSDPKEIFGIAIVEVNDKTEMCSLIANDPAVKAGVHLKDEFYPMDSRTFVKM
jgi:C-terminal processing protease CtpA/Prc